MYRFVALVSFILQELDWRRLKGGDLKVLIYQTHFVVIIYYIVQDHLIPLFIAYIYLALFFF